MKRVVILCFTFPPFPGIGGRRWAKFAKYMHRNGCDIRVIAAKKEHPKTSLWKDDIREFEDRIEYIPDGYPHILTSIPSNFFERWWYRFCLVFVRLRISKGNYFDHSSFWGMNAASAVEKWIREGYDNVIISCGPFRFSNAILALREKYPKVKFILDFRDPWANNHTSFGFQTISSTRREFEFKMEISAIQNADLVVSVSDDMNEYFRKISHSSGNRFLTIGNGFDREDFPAAQVLPKREQVPLRFILTGTLYQKTKYVFDAFVNAFSELLNENIWYEKVRFEFYGAVPNWFSTSIQGLEKYISYGGNLDLVEVYSKIEMSDVCMLFLTDDLVYSRSTKFYEYLAMGKPIAVFSIPGETGKFASENQLGFACSPDRMKQDMEDMIQSLFSGTFHFNSDFDISDHDIEALTQKWISCLL